MEMAVETRERVTNTSKQHKEPIDGPEYSIYNYFRINTGFAIAVISGVVAVSSFVFRYASTLYTYAYLRFWDIDTAYARQEDAGVFYIALAVFFYYCLVMLSQYLLGNTVTVYIHHNRFYLAIKELQKKLKKKSKANLKIRRRLSKLLKKETLDKRRTRLIDRISKVDARITELSTLRTDLKIKYAHRIWLNIMAVISAVISFLLCMAGAWFLSVNYEDGAKAGMFWVLVVVPALLSLLMIAFQKRPKINDDQDIKIVLDQYQQEVNEGQTMLFPVEAWAKKGIKYFLTNKMIGKMVVQYLITVVACIMVLVNSGSNHAEQLREFKVWTDGSSIYAIIYDNGTQVIMEPINIKGDSAVIDTSSQRIIKSDDLSYEIYTFDAIEVIRSDSKKCKTTGVEPGTKYPSVTNI